MRFRVIEVTARFTPDGWPHPTALRWQGEQLAVVATGRRWREPDGIHLLVRVGDGRVFELHTNGALWRAALLGAPPRFA